MNYTDNYKGVKLDVQAVDLTLNDNVQRTIRDVIDKLSKYVDHINFADFYLRIQPTSTTTNKYVSIRLGVPGPDAYAEDSGEYFEPTLRSVGAKLERQLRKMNGK